MLISSCDLELWIDLVPYTNHNIKNTINFETIDNNGYAYYISNHRTVIKYDLYSGKNEKSYKIHEGILTI